MHLPVAKAGLPPEFRIDRQCCYLARRSIEETAVVLDLSVT
jgi:hypothetical protein